MFDMLPFPNINSSKTPEDQVVELTHYLIQFKETLEFILTNISFDNLSQDVIDKLNSLGAEIEKNIKSQEEQIQQVSQKPLNLTASDVINSDVFKAAMKKEHTFTINFDTGNLEYTIQ